MNILVVGNVIKDVYLNLDSRTEKFEIDKNGTKWLDLSFDASEHHFFSRESNLGGVAVTFEVLQKMGLNAVVSDSDLAISEEGLSSSQIAETYRYILVSDGQVSYLTQKNHKETIFSPPTELYDYIYIDRSAELTSDVVNKINAYLDISPNTKLITYVKNFNNQNLNNILVRSNLVFLEDTDENIEFKNANNLNDDVIVTISEQKLSYLNVTEKLSLNRIDILTHLSAYSIISATILGGFALGLSVEESLKLARANAENSKLDSVLTLEELQEIASNFNTNNNLELISANLLLGRKGILAADESGGSIKKKFEQLNIPDTYENRRDYRNIFFTTPDLEKYINGVILFDETTHQLADDGQNFVEYLTSKRIIPGIKVDQGLEKFEDSDETYTKGLEDLPERLKAYYLAGLRFAKWRAAFEIHLSDTGEVITPSLIAIDENCRILAEYASNCQTAGLVPIVEPEVVYNGDYSIDVCYNITASILDKLFECLAEHGVKLNACILKTNMVLAGKQYLVQSTPNEVGEKTAKVLKEHVPSDLAGVVFLSGGQTTEQATDNLSAIIKNGPFPWPVTFSFARALQDPALFTWQGDNNNAKEAKKAFLERLIANTDALKSD